MKRNLMIILLVICMGITTGCGGGPSYLRKDIGIDAKSAKKYAIVVSSYDIFDSAAKRISNEQIQQAIRDVIGDTISEKFARNFLSATVVKEADVKVAVDNFKAVPVNWRRVKLIDDTTNLGDQRETFKSIDADMLLIVSGYSSIRNPNWAAGLGKTAAEMAISAATSMVISTGGAPPTTVAFFTAVDRNGRVVYFDREQFTKHGDIIATDERSDMMKSLFDRYYENVAK